MAEMSDDFGGAGRRGPAVQAATESRTIWSISNAMAKFRA